MNAAVGFEERASSSPVRPGIRADFERVVVILIKPTSYDADGYPYRFLRAVLPSNSLAAMNSLTRAALAETIPEGVECEVHICEDGVKRHALELERLARRFPEAGTKLIVGLVAVQTSQFPRAVDLIDAWQGRGATCVIGGFHVSGSIGTMLDGIADRHRPDAPCPGVMPPEVQELMDRGVVVFHGEAESVWKEALGDILSDRPQSLYRGGRPPLEAAPLPEYPSDYFDGSFATPVQTFDTGRGCPFLCSFCTIINVQGRQSRHRSPAAILAAVKQLCRERGKANFFFTDDNFARNPKWREILEGLAELRRQGYRISFMIEADLACYRLPDFLTLLAEAGCFQIFMGVESMNPRNLDDARKRQNRIEEYARLWSLCHECGIVVHAGYIIGFPHDTPESVERDIEELFRLGVDEASFFILTPLPGSEDHIRAWTAGVKIDGDFNRFDSFHTVTDHPKMTRAEWFATYRKAWRRFYRVSNMIEALKRCRLAEVRRTLLRGFIWYRWSFAAERVHPMISGFYRFRDRRDRRPGAAPVSRLGFAWQEVKRHVRYLGCFFAEFYRFQHVVFETRYAPMIADRREEWADRIHGARDWFHRTFGRAVTRRWLNRFWIDYARLRWRLLFDPTAIRWHLRMAPHALTEVIYTLRFALEFKDLMKSAKD